MKSKAVINSSKIFIINVDTWKCITVVNSIDAYTFLFCIKQWVPAMYAIVNSVKT